MGIIGLYMVLHIRRAEGRELQICMSCNTETTDTYFVLLLDFYLLMSGWLFLLYLVICIGLSLLCNFYRCFSW